MLWWCTASSFLRWKSVRIIRVIISVVPCSSCGLGGGVGRQSLLRTRSLTSPCPLLLSFLRARRALSSPSLLHSAEAFMLWVQSQLGQGEEGGQEKAFFIQERRTGKQKEPRTRRTKKNVCLVCPIYTHPWLSKMGTAQEVMRVEVWECVACATKVTLLEMADAYPRLL